MRRPADQIFLSSGKNKYLAVPVAPAEPVTIGALWAGRLVFRIWTSTKSGNYYELPQDQLERVPGEEKGLTLLRTTLTYPCLVKVAYRHESATDTWAFQLADDTEPLEIYKQMGLIKLHLDWLGMDPREVFVLLSELDTDICEAYSFAQRIVHEHGEEAVNWLMHHRAQAALSTEFVGQERTEIKALLAGAIKIAELLIQRLSLRALEPRVLDTLDVVRQAAAARDRRRRSR